MPPRIDGFDDLTLIGRGGFGTVYRARQTRVDRVVAVKVLDVVDVDEAARRRFERECQAMGRLSWHPHVVVLHDSGLCEEDSRPWLSMEYLPAGSFGDLVETRGALAWQDALARGVEVAGALGAAHGAGVLHRDLKPENLLVGPFGEAKLGDFGIAAFEGSGATTGHATFSVAHVAPEILEGAEPDERADLYGLASTLFTLVDGAPPVVDGSPSLAAQITRVLREPARTLSGVPDDVARLLAESLAKDPDVRPVDAAAFGQQLQRAQRDHGLPVTELRLAARGVAERGLDENAAAEAEDEPPSDGGSGAGPTSIEGPGARPAADRRPTISIPTPGPLPAPAPRRTLRRRLRPAPSRRGRRPVGVDDRRGRSPPVRCWCSSSSVGRSSGGGPTGGPTTPRVVRSRRRPAWSRSPWDRRRAASWRRRRGCGSPTPTTTRSPASRDRVTRSPRSGSALSRTGWPRRPTRSG
ncbi:MAG: serine/threonine protein kinase [Microthrixaceae bacterium]|nr:serine/threonine protein kinase [Microthrixaceae bacterium]